MAVRKGTAEHFHYVLSGEQGIGELRRDRQFLQKDAQEQDSIP